VRAAALLVAALAALPAAPASALDAGAREAAARSVVQVRARECPDGDRAGSGFVYAAAGSVVTALHVVAGCRRLSVFAEKHGGRVYDAEVARVLSGPDLVLLRAPAAPGEPLRRSATPPEVNEEVEALGYYLGVPTMDNKPLRVTFGATRLASMLPDHLRDELRRTQAIDIELDIVRMDGHLLPGLSGAPILNARGEVVAVGSGGLQSGAASVSFGMPAAHLDALVVSNESVVAAAQAPSGLFAARLESGAGGGAAQPAASTLTCGGLAFVDAGLRSFDDLALSTDDPNGLSYLLSESELDAERLAAFRYRIWTPVEGGAAIAVPATMTVRASGATGTCVAESPAGGLRIEFGGRAVASFQDAQMASVQFEQAFIQRSGRFWEPVPMFSYLAPLQRFDGLVATRKTAVGWDALGTGALGFETLMARGPVFTGAVAVADGYDFRVLSYCDETPWDPQCAPLSPYIDRLYEAIFGVFLSTFPII
jgi:S1-C subfamily serine protease